MIYSRFSKTEKLYTSFILFVSQTVEKAADYCQKNGIPFPNIEKQEMDKESPSDCYIFRGDKSCPTVMHFPLFNKVNCSGNIYLMLFCLYVLAFHIFNFLCQAFESPLLPSDVVNGHRRKGREQALVIINRCLCRC